MPIAGFLKILGKKIAFEIVVNKTEDGTLVKVILSIFITILFIIIATFSFICLTPLSILSSAFSGININTLIDIKSENGHMQTQDVEFLKNKGISTTRTDQNGNIIEYESEEYSEIFIENNSNSNCVYFNQADSRWANHPYAGTTSYWASCGPTSMSMVVSTLSGNIVGPPEMMDIATKSGYACDGAGSYHSIVPGISKQFGLKCQGIGSNGAKLKKALEDGNLVVALMGPGDFTRNGHFIVLRGITSDGKVLINDPSSTVRTQKSWDFNKFPEQSIKWASSGGPFWVISK